MSIIININNYKLIVVNNSFYTCIINLFTYIDYKPPTNIRATVLTPRSVEVIWDVSSSSGVTGYLISYTTTASYTSGGNVTVSGGSTSGTLTNLEEDTLYTITVQAIGINNRMSVNSNEVSVITYTDGK